MGYYIETKQCRGKVEAILKDAVDSKVEDRPYFDPTGKRVGVCVVDNGPFEAAGIAFSQEEMEVFGNPQDWRPKTWLSLPRAEVIKLCSYVEDMLPPLNEG